MPSMPLNFDPIALVMAILNLGLTALQLYWARPQRGALAHAYEPAPGASGAYLARPAGGQGH
jgi:hypothetical protein